MAKVIFNDSMLDIIFSMTDKQVSEKKEQFATGYGRINSGELVIESFEEWPDYLFNSRTESFIDIGKNSWKWVLQNMADKDADFVLTLHTHPEEYGTNHPLDEYDFETFKAWDKFFQDDFNEYVNESGGHYKNIININGIMAKNGGLKLYIYDEKENRFTNVDYDIDYNNMYSEDNIRNRR